jgi:hypothetical protein
LNRFKMVGICCHKSAGLCEYDPRKNFQLIREFAIKTTRKRSIAHYSSCGSQLKKQFLIILAQFSFSTRL